MLGSRWTLACPDESAWLPPCMILVINDNLYELIFALSYICRLSICLLVLHLLESRLREEEKCVLIKALCRLIITQGQVNMCRRECLPSWCMGEHHVNLHRAKRNEEMWCVLRS